jgi:2-dehydro-3-deoxyphosphogluconate aldolase/(4S)-4-hydroxy-2-oxoglutarate aldolase
MNRQEVRSRIETVGIVPSIRVAAAEEAIFAAQAIAGGGIPIFDIALTVPDALGVISQVARYAPDALVGAGGVNDVETARRCVAAGAQFLTSDGFDPDTVRFAVQQEIVVFPGALTPTEVIAAWKLCPDFIKVVPCGHIGADRYIRSLREMFPNIPLIAAGGVNQQNAFDLVRAGALALGIGVGLIPREAIRHREPDQIAELARRFRHAVDSARAQFGR